MTSINKPKLADLLAKLTVLLAVVGLAIIWTKTGWAAGAVAGAGSLALFSFLHGGRWRVVAGLGAIGAVGAGCISGLGEGFPNSPGVPAVAAYTAAAVTFLLIGVSNGHTPAVTKWGGWLALALWCGGLGALFSRPSEEGINRGDITESVDGLIEVNRHLMAAEEPGHDSWRLELPGRGGSSWSIGHSLYFARHSGWKVIGPGACFLPVTDSKGKPVPFWTYLGGGGLGVSPIAAMRTVGLMGAGT